MTNDERLEKVYSPDIKPYSFEGKSGIFGTLLSIIMAPVRIISRVTHNVFILPANLQEGFADKWLLVSCILLAIGFLDFVIEKKWPLLVSQIPGIFLSLRLKRQASKSTEIATEKREVDIDIDQVTELCNSVYSEFESIVEE